MTMIQSPRARDWSLSILRLLRESTQEGTLDPKACRSIVIGIDASWTRIQCWWLEFWGFEFNRWQQRPDLKEYRSLFSFGIPDLLGAVDRLDAEEESEIPETKQASWVAQTDQSRPRFSAALGALLTEAHEDLLEACRLLARDPAFLEFPGMVAFCEYGRTRTTPLSALRLVCFVGHPEAAPLRPFIEHRAPMPGKKTLRLQGWAARTPEGLRLFYPDGDVPELNRLAQRPVTRHYRWADLDDFALDQSPEYAHGKVSFREKGSPVKLVFFPRPPTGPGGGSPADTLHLFGGGRLQVWAQPDWPFPRENDPAPPDLRAPREFSDDEVLGLESALARWIERKYDLHLYLYPEFKTGGVGLFRNGKTLVVTVSAPESFAASCISWRGHTGERYATQKMGGTCSHLDRVYVEQVLGLEVSSDLEEELKSGTLLGERLGMILPDPEFRQQLFSGLFERIEGMKAFQKSATGRVTFGTRPGGVVRTLRDPAKPWVPFLLPFADRHPYQDFLLQDSSRRSFKDPENPSLSLVRLKMAAEYAEQDVYRAVRELWSSFGVHAPNLADPERMSRVERELPLAPPELQAGLLEIAYREFSRCGDPAFERFLLDFAMGDAKPEVRKLALEAVQSGQHRRDDTDLAGSHEPAILLRSFGTVQRAIAFVLSILPRMKGQKHQMNWDELWILRWLRGGIQWLPDTLLTAPGETHRLIEAILGRVKAATEEESRWTSEMLELVVEIVRHPAAPREWRDEVRPVFEFLSQERDFKFYETHRIAKKALEPGGLMPRSY